MAEQCPYSARTKMELINECKARGIKCSGKKADLVAYLKADDAKAKHTRKAATPDRPAKVPRASTHEQDQAGDDAQAQRREAGPSDRPEMQRASADDAEVAGDEFGCPICYQVMLPPIYLCPTGHSICSGLRGACCRGPGLFLSLTNVVPPALR